MPSNDTENIYTTQYGGEGEPIPATKISYDGTGTSIEATTVQAAITEVDTDLQSTKEDVSDLKDAVRNGYIMIDPAMVVSVTADGVKSYSDMLTELNTAVNTAIAALEDDEIIFINRMAVDGVATLLPIAKSTGYTNADSNISPLCIRTEITDTTFISFAVRFGTTNIFRRCDINATPAVTISDKLSDVPTSGNKLSVNFYKYRAV